MRVELTKKRHDHFFKALLMLYILTGVWVHRGVNETDAILEKNLPC